jgi:hypothetical protein
MHFRATPVWGPASWLCGMGVSDRPPGPTRPAERPAAGDTRANGVTLKRRDRCLVPEQGFEP